MTVRRQDDGSVHGTVTIPAGGIVEVEHGCGRGANFVAWPAGRNVGPPYVRLVGLDDTAARLTVDGAAGDDVVVEWAAKPTEAS